DNGLGDGVAALCGSPRSARLECLDLTGNAITPEVARQRAGPTAWTQLRTLLLDSNDINDAALQVLTDGLLRIEWLRRTRNWITTAGVSALTSSARLDRLKCLDLGDNPLGPEGAKAIARCAALGELRQLDLHACDIGVEGMLADAQLQRLHRPALQGAAYRRA